MTSKGMEGIKKQLELLKRKGADVDPDAIIKDLTAPVPVHKVEKFESSFDNEAFQLMKQKVIKLLEDFENFYGPKDRGLSIAMHVQKENSADRFSETFNYVPDKLSIVHIVDIGTKGKYEPVVIDEKLIEEERKKVEEKEKRLGRT